MDFQQTLNDMLSRSIKISSKQRDLLKRLADKEGYQITETSIVTPIQRVDFEEVKIFSGGKYHTIPNKVKLKVQ